MNDNEDRYKDWDAAYVLGALSAEEHKEYESHLARCADCSLAVTQFAGIPGKLSKLDSQTAITLLEGGSQVPGPSSWNESAFIQKLANRVEQERSKTRFRQRVGLVAAAVISITIGVAVDGVIREPSNRIPIASNSVSGKAIHVTNFSPEVITATFRVTSKAWGTRVDWSCSYPNGISQLYSSTSYNLIVVDTSGRKTTIATWSATGDKATGLSATSALPTTQIKAFEITAAGSSHVLVSGEI